MTETRTAPNGRGPALDDLDKAIVRALQTNGRLSNTEIARELSVTETTIRKRMARLLDEGYLQVLAVPTPRALAGTTSAIIGVSTDLHRLAAVTAAVSAKPEVRYAGVSVGRYDLMVEAVFTDQQHLLRFITEELGSIDGVTDVETSIILEVAKFSYEWELP